MANTVDKCSPNLLRAKVNSAPSPQTELKHMSSSLCTTRSQLHNLNFCMPFCIYFLDQSNLEEDGSCLTAITELKDDTGMFKVLYTVPSTTVSSKSLPVLMTDSSDPWWTLHMPATIRSRISGIWKPRIQFRFVVWALSTTSQCALEKQARIWNIDETPTFLVWNGVQASQAAL